MGLTIDMCNDIEKYEESVLIGMNAKKTLYFIAAAVVGIGAMFLFYKVFHWNLIISAYAMMPFSGIIILSGFSSQNGLTLGQTVLRRLKKTNYKPLTYCSTENRKNYEAALEIVAKNDYTELSEDDKKSEIAKTMKKLKLTAICLAFAFIVVVILIVVLK